MPATVNVNLDHSCYCERLGIGADPHHVPTCPAKPVLIPCTIPPAVEMVVRPGECAGPAFSFRCRNGHTHDCPARPIRVSCSIGGDGTWAGSLVADWATSTPVVGMAVGAFRRMVRAAVDGRWALVKALVLGATWRDARPDHIEWPFALFSQRDAVYAALADMARAEMMLQHAEQECARHLHRANVPRIGPSPAASWLAAYVERLIEQVGAL